MILAYFILAHLLGDFVLQSNALVKWKKHSKTGVFAHVLVHFGLNLLLFAPFLLYGQKWPLYAAIILFGLHFLIDQCKINYDLKHDKKVKPFLLDQLFHFLSIFAVYTVFKPLYQPLPETGLIAVYSNLRIIYFLSFIVLVSIVVEVYRFENLRERQKNAKFKVDSNQMLNRILVLTFFYLIFTAISYFL